MSSAPIDLTKTQDFSLGRLTITPSTLQVRRGGEQEMLEPRVMQVLTALTLAGGQVVSRDDLIAQCWDGRVVGDDAINRVIGRLRRLAETTADADQGASFTIETVPRVGYRLIAAATEIAAERVAPAASFETPHPAPAQASPPAAPAAAPPPKAGFDRRLLLAGAGGAAAAAAVAIGWWTLHPQQAAITPAPTDPVIDDLLKAGFSAHGESTAEGLARAMAIFQQAVARAPRNANAWGGLALSYANSTHVSPSTAVAMQARARDAMRQSLALELHNEYVTEARAVLLPLRGNWGQRERIYRAGLRYRPNAPGLLMGLAYNLANVGRMYEASELMNRAVAHQTAYPENAWLRIHLLWGAGRLVEADKASQEGIAQFPRQRFVWFSRLYTLMYTGQIEAALAALRDEDNRPLGVPDRDFDELLVVGAAIKSRKKADIDRVVPQQMAAAARGVGYAENAMQFLSFLDRVDEAFAIARADYFGEGFQVADTRFTKQEGAVTILQDRRTIPLFVPATRAMRRDPRFAVLTRDLGLDRYWQDSRVPPDFRISPEP